MTDGAVTEGERLLAAYDQQLRTEAETLDAVAVRHLGPLWLATFAGGRGFVTYPHPDGDVAGLLPELVGRVVDHYLEDPEVTEVEWKTRGHDAVPGLHGSLLRHGFRAGDRESVMIGRAERLAVDVSLPRGVALRRIGDERDVRAMVAMQDVVFGRDSTHLVQALLSRLARHDGMELWVAEAGREVVGAGRLEPVPGTDFAGIWGGATLEAWRGQGIYRALTAARARSALAAGKTLIQSDSTEYSRPILERSGFLRVSTTTPYRWHR